MEQKNKVAFTPVMEKMKLICAFVICFAICACGGNKKKATEEQKVYNLIIIDESGSMSRIEEEAVSGLNETFQTIAAAQEEHKHQKHYVSLVTFNGVRIRNVFDRKPVGKDSLKWDDYHPHTSTPLFDAMGYAIDTLRKHVTPEDIVLVTIITDGRENASEKYSGKQIKEMVSKLRKRGWVFAYIGTNQDVDAVAEEIGIRSRMEYEHSKKGVRDMWRTDKESRKRFYYRSAYYGRSAVDENYEYFDER